MAHDFNNLLTVISGYSELLLESREFAGPLLKYGEEIKKAADRAARLTRQLLAYSRRQVMIPETLEVKTVVADMAGMLKPLLGEAIEVVTVHEPGGNRIEADRGQLEQVIMNLAVNARDAMPEGGKLVIESASATVDQDFARTHKPMPPGAYVRLSVVDTGLGMDQGTLARIFEPFFTTKPQGKRTGLGLSTVYGIVKQSGGFIWVESEMGKGTRFDIYWPPSEGHSLSPRPAKVRAERGTGLETILVVESEGTIRSLLTTLLRASGYTVLEARNGDEALALSRNYAGPIHLVISDVVMPGTSAPKMIEELERMRPEADVLFTSGSTEGALLKTGTRFLRKPFSPEAIRRKVREILDA